MIVNFSSSSLAIFVKIILKIVLFVFWLLVFLRVYYIVVKVVNCIYLILEISYKMNKKHSPCSFQDEWLSDYHFRA